MAFTSKKVILLGAVLAAANAWATDPASPEAPKYDLSGGFGNINGVTYRAYDDFGGIFAGTAANDLSDYRSNWSVGCKRDAMNDSRFCTLTRQSLAVMVESGKVVYLKVGSRHFPGKQTAIRVDANKAHTGQRGSDGDFTSGQLPAIVQQLTQGKSVTTRYFEWPYDSPKDETFVLTGFKEALDFVMWASQRVK